MTVQFVTVQEEERLISGVKKIDIFTKKSVHNPPHVTIWAGISGRQIFDPYFFEGSMKSTHLFDNVESLFGITHTNGSSRVASKKS
jgi:hypothetical protein